MVATLIYVECVFGKNLSGHTDLKIHHHVIGTLHRLGLGSPQCLGLGLSPEDFITLA